MRLTSTLALAAALMALTSCAEARQAAAVLTDFSELDRTVRASCEAGEHTGAVVLAIGGEVAYSHLCGEDVTAESRFKLLTSSQLITALAVMRLVEQDVLALDAPVERYVTDLPRGWRGVTIRQLLGQTSGVHDHTNLLRSLYGTEKAPDHASAMRLLFQEPDVAVETPNRRPGEAYRMNRFGFDLLAHAAERATGEPFAALLQRLVFEPAGMKDATVETAVKGRDGLVPAADARLAPGWTDERGPKRKTVAPVFAQLGSAAVYATTADLIALDRALAENRVVEARSWTRMLEDTTLIHPSNPEAVYGLGVMVEPRLGLESHGHNGGIDGYISSFRRFPAQDAVIVGLFNSGWSGSRWIEEAAARALTPPEGEPVS